MRDKFYETSVINRDGVDGIAYVDREDGLRVITSSPTSSRPGTNPEELFALALATCLNATIKAILKKSERTNESLVKIDVQLMLDQSDMSYYFAVQVYAAIADMELEEAKEIVALAEKRCPVSKLVQGASTISFTTLPYESLGN